MLMKSFLHISELNQLERDEWVASRIAKYYKEGSIVLDVGAGTTPYKNLLSKYEYIAHDFGAYDGVKLGGAVDYGHINIKSDILAIPLANGTVDNILCTEVLEHVPHPMEAIGEFARLLKPGGTAVITAPFTSGSHQGPYHYYAGFSKNFYQIAAEKYKLDVLEISSHGGFLRLMAQELGRLDGVYKRLESVGYQSKVDDLSASLLMIANELFLIDKQLDIPEFSIGFHVVLKKI